MDSERREKISKALKGNMRLKQAMKNVHARRIASGEDSAIREKIRKTREAKGDWAIRNKDEWDEYRKRVRQETSRQPLHTLKDIEKRGRGKNKYHLDHIISQRAGFLIGMPPEFIGHISNLRMIPESENCSKQHYVDDLELMGLWFRLTRVIE
jgi:hypothetical protein